MGMILVCVFSREMWRTKYQAEEWWETCSIYRSSNYSIRVCTLYMDRTYSATLYGGW